MYKGIAHIQMAHRTERVESGEFPTKEMALAELQYFISKALPMRESFKVVQQVITIK